MDKLWILKLLIIPFFLVSIGASMFSLMNIMQLLQDKRELNNKVISREEFNKRNNTLNLYIILYSIPSIALFILTFYITRITMIATKLL